jgi:hypothetical protein
LFPHAFCLCVASNCHLVWPVFSGYFHLTYFVF